MPHLYALKTSQTCAEKTLYTCTQKQYSSILYNNYNERNNVDKHLKFWVSRKPFIFLKIE